MLVDASGGGHAGSDRHARGVETVHEAFETGSERLAGEAARLAERGPNRLPRADPVAWWTILPRQFENPPIYALAAAEVSFAIGEEIDAAFVALVSAINAAVGGVQEWQAERSSQALQRLLRTRATVVRDGEPRDVDGEEVVPGDVVLLESGYRVPADVRLVSTHGLEIDEAPLTGESAPREPRMRPPAGSACRRNRPN